MNARRDIFIYVPEPGRADEAVEYVADWVASLGDHPGFLGGSVLRESAGELLPGTLVLLLEFESTEAARALWPKIENTINPLYADDKSDKRSDQGAAFFDGTKERVESGAPLELVFNRGDGRLARMLHIHAEVVREISTTD